MKRILTCFMIVFGLLLLTTEAFAQPKHALSYRNLYYNYVTPKATDCTWSDIFTDSPGHRGIELAYQRRIDHNTYVVFPLKFGLAEIPQRATDVRPRNETVGNFDVLIQRQFFKYGRFINPYVHFGLGSTYRFKKEEFNLNLPLGVGLNFKIFENFYLSAQTQYRASDRKHEGWHHGIGLTVFFGDNQDADRDKDKVLDKVDRCPDVFGLVDLGGCPDMDGDKIADMDDKCPDVAGIAELSGCPDKDMDGITDLEDECPTEKGLAQFAGCPDTDSDGLADKNDKCPKEAGPIANGGCPVLDRDGDGINDKDDACPDTKGSAATRGCPDRDADGIADKDDVCPDLKGVAAGKGCPDSDGDGLYDNGEDRCPTVAGTRANKGCPEVAKEKLANITKNVLFETGKATLLTRSYPVLDEVVGLMAQYKEYSLRISGHTDNVGDDAMNHDLSHRRAKACFDYLVSKGVTATRMSSAGYGETQPIADNKTKAGRDTNRRVNFELYVP